MTLEEMKQRKQELGYSVSDLARLSGVPQATLQKIFSGITKVPRHETLVRLESVLKKTETPRRYVVPAAPGCVGEAAPAYRIPKKEPDNPYGNKKQGDYTIEDYLSLPEDKRYELIDGVIYEMAAPSADHQFIVLYLARILWDCAEKHHMSCQPFVSPLDVQLDKNSKTMVQPDVIVICNPCKRIHKRLFGAPDFAAEIISDGSRRKDMIIKLNKYMNAGVKEYWMIDPRDKKVYVWVFGDEDSFTTYTFEDDIPVAISHGLCTIPFAPVQEYLIDSEQ